MTYKIIKGSKMKKLLIFILAIIILLGACSPKNIPEDVAPTPSSDYSEIEEITPAYSSEESEEAAPPTPTNVSADSNTTKPTNTPVPQENTDAPSDYPPEGYGPENFPDNINPLTGLSVENPELLDQRPISVKMPLFPRSVRPQWGLSQAALVYEYYHNGGITRFNVIFYGREAEQLAPIRSARFSDENFIRMYKATLTFGGTYEDVSEHFFNSSFASQLLYTVTSDPCPPREGYPVCRYDPDNMNHLMGNTKLLSEYFTAQGLDNIRQDLDGMFFQVNPPQDAETGTQLRIRYTDANFHLWDYHSDIEEYVRYQENETTSEESYSILTDNNNNIPISADNVVVLIVPHKKLESDHEAYYLQLSGSGDAYAFRDGKMYLVQWNRPTLDSVLYLTFPNGDLFPFRPGNTWFEVIGINSDIIEQDVGLKIRAYIP
ncbi:MAG: hypothetical protein B5M51_02715 [Anaerolinea sp. 4484_236]|nr:MAG: hypothetical protein B5M51_02715 [Anaerolinea sp. 4484_236]